MNAAEILAMAARHAKPLDTRATFEPDRDTKASVFAMALTDKIVSEEFLSTHRDIFGQGWAQLKERAPGGWFADKGAPKEVENVAAIVETVVGGSALPVPAIDLDVGSVVDSASSILAGFAINRPEFAVAPPVEVVEAKVEEEKPKRTRAPRKPKTEKEHVGEVANSPGCYGSDPVSNPIGNPFDQLRVGVAPPLQVIEAVETEGKGWSSEVVENTEPVVVVVRDDLPSTLPLERGDLDSLPLEAGQEEGRPADHVGGSDPVTPTEAKTVYVPSLGRQCVVGSRVVAQTDIGMIDGPDIKGVPFSYVVNEDGELSEGCPLKSLEPLAKAEELKRISKALSKFFAVGVTEKPKQPTKPIGTLYIHCVVSNDPTMAFDSVLAEAHARVQASTGAAHWRFIDYGKGAGAIAQAVGAVIDDTFHGEDLVVQDCDELIPCMSTLLARASRVVRPLR